VVQPGDNLWNIAIRLLGSGTRLKEIKGSFTDPDKIDPGMILYIPSKYNQPISYPVPKPSREYKVVRGDTLWGIADRELNNGNRWREIHGWEKYGELRLPIGILLQLPI
jgi:nucleoid-associated protein YgaU